MTATTHEQARDEVARHRGRCGSREHGAHSRWRAALVAGLVGAAPSAGAAGGPPSPQSACERVRAALVGLATSWPHRERAFMAVGGGVIPDAELETAWTWAAERIPPDRERVGPGTPAERVTIGRAVYAPQGNQTWRRYAGPPVELGLPLHGGERISDCSVTSSSRDETTISFWVAEDRLHDGQPSRYRIVLGRDGRPTRLDAADPALAHMVLQYSWRYEYDGQIRIDAPPVEKAEGEDPPVECAPSGRAVRGTYSSGEGGFEIAIPMGRVGCESAADRGLPGVEVPLRGPDDPVGQRAIKVNPLPALLATSVNEAAAFYRGVYDHARSHYAIPEDWTVGDAQVGQLTGKRLHFSTREEVPPSVVRMDILVVSDATRSGSPVYQLALKSPPASFAEDAGAFESVIASFRARPVAGLQRRDSGGK